MRRVVPLLLVVLAASGWGHLRQGAPDYAAAGAVLPPSAVRAPDASTAMDTNPSNLASAVVTHAFGQLPEYVDGAAFRLLPYDLFRAAEPGVRSVRAYRVTTPRTSLVLDAAVVSSLTEAEVRRDAARFRVAVSLDGRRLAHPERYWVFYRNDGPQICRIYFPGDLAALHMGVSSLVLRPPAPGWHELEVTVRQALPGGRSATLLTRYALHVLARRPNAAERASAPREDANPRALGNTPLVLRTPKR